MSILFSPPSPSTLFAVIVESVCQPGERCLVLKTGWQGKGLGEVGKEERERRRNSDTDARGAQATAPPTSPHTAAARRLKAAWGLGRACAVSEGKRAGNRHLPDSEREAQEVQVAPRPWNRTGQGVGTMER